MLRELRIQNYAIISEVSLEFSEGLNVITGETGAGKSILIDALSCLLGGRSSPEFIREGANEAVLEACFDPIDFPLLNEFPSSEGLILKRILSRSAKNRTYLNNSFATVSTLKEVGQRLTEIHGQHEHHNLTNLDWQLDLLDAFGNLSEQRKQVESRYHAWNHLLQERAELQKLGAEGKQKQAFIEYQLSELKSANLQLGEEEALEKEENTLKNWEAFLSATEKSYALLSEEGGILSRLDETGDTIHRLNQITNDAADEVQLWENAKINLKELSTLLRNRFHDLEYDPHRLHEVTERLYLIQKLKKKYGLSIQEILQLQSQLEVDLSKLSHYETQLGEIKQKIEEAEKDLTEEANSLSRVRLKSKEKLEKKVQEELLMLGMEKTRFQISFDRKPLSEDGIDRIEFLIALPGEKPQSLSSIASGGELSRMMLALKVILAEVDPVGVLVFDEVDAGIGGGVAERVGKRLLELSKTHQVFCITHLPQIARFADHHYYVEKDQSGNRVTTSVKRLSKEGRVRELARMLGGVTITPITLQHAEEMIGRKSSREESISLPQTKQWRKGRSK
jgi:DNA repair protein RecN (Recombination protein N)